MSIGIGKAIYSFDEACRLYNRTWPKENEEFLQSTRVESFKETVENFGRKWVATREPFLISSVESVIATIHCFVIALIESGFALIKGQAKDETLNKNAIEAWSDTGKALRYIGQSIVGIGAPSFAIKIDDFIKEKMKSAKNEQDECNFN